jgi:hypothetical protein
LVRLFIKREIIAVWKCIFLEVKVRVFFKKYNRVKRPGIPAVTAIKIKELAMPAEERERVLLSFMKRRVLKPTPVRG